MTDMIRFEYGFIPELKRHKITSPDLKGFYVTGATVEETEREALAMVALINATEPEQRTRRIAGVVLRAAE